MKPTCYTPACITIRSLFRLVSALPWLAGCALALAALTSSATTITYTLSASDGAHRLDATLTVNDQAPYSEDYSSRRYRNGAGQRAVVSGSFVVRSLSNGEAVEQGLVSSQTTNFIVSAKRGSYPDRLYFFFISTSGIAVEIFADWADQNTFSSYAPPTSFPVQPSRIACSGGGFFDFTQSVVLLANVNLAELLAPSAWEAQVAALQTQLNTANTTITTLNDENTELHQELVGLQNELTATTTQIATLQTEKAALQAEVANLQAQLTNANQTIAARDASIGQLTTEKAALEQQLATANDRISELEAKAATLRTTIAACEAAIADLQHQLAAANTQIAELQGQIAALQMTLAAREVTIQELQEHLATANATIGSLNGRLSTAHAMIVDLQTQLAAANAAIVARDATIGALRADLATAQGQIAALQGNLTTANASLTRFVTSFRGTFNNSSFTLAGPDVNAQLNALIDGILGMNRGSQQQLYFQLTGKK